MGVIGERKLQELIDKAEFEVSQGTPRDIASRGLWEACADALEGRADLEAKVEELETHLGNDLDAAQDLQKLVNGLVDEDDKVVDESDTEALLRSIFDALKDYAAKTDEKRLEQKARVESLTEELDEARARIAELERAGAPALRERVTYLETGLRRLMLEAHKLRRGVL